MPIHLLWGDDSAARDRAVATLIEEAIDPNWSSINLSRLDGNEAGQAQQALEEARTPPFGAGNAGGVAATLPLLQCLPKRTGRSL